MKKHEWEEKVIGAYGDAGRRWMQGLPAEVEACAREWNLTLGEPFPELSYGYLQHVKMKDGRDAILKLVIPDRPHELEVKALLHFQHRGGVELLNYDISRGWQLLEVVRPGDTLRDFGSGRDEEATRIAAEFMKGLYQPVHEPDAEFASVGEWRESIIQSDGDRLKGHRERALEWINHLLATMPAPVVIHGDMHHGNILRCDRQGWRLIDASGMLGEPACDVANWMHNPMPDLCDWPDLSGLISRRLDIFAEVLDIDRQRLAQWSYVHTVISVCWMLEDKLPDWECVLELAEIFRRESGDAGDQAVSSTSS